MSAATVPAVQINRDVAARAGQLFRRVAGRSFSRARRSAFLGGTPPPLPSILVVTIPKSGTVFTNQMLSRGLSLEPTSVSFGYFPHYLVDIPKLVSFIEGGQVASAHFDASPVNLQSLTAFVKKWVVHIRDPRSVTLSWVHHMNRLYSERHDGKFHHLFVLSGPSGVVFRMAVSPASRLDNRTLSAPSSNMDALMARGMRTCINTTSC